jgi:hypothetical protein
MVWWTLQGIRRVRCDAERPKQVMTLDVLRGMYRVAVDRGATGNLEGNRHTACRLFRDVAKGQHHPRQGTRDVSFTRLAQR